VVAALIQIKQGADDARPMFDYDSPSYRGRSSAALGNTRKVRLGPFASTVRLFGGLCALVDSRLLRNRPTITAGETRARHAEADIEQRLVGAGLKSK
jgi:hypothetical protein